MKHSAGNPLNVQYFVFQVLCENRILLILFQPGMYFCVSFNFSFV